MQTHGQTDIQTHGQPDTQPHRQTKGQTERRPKSILTLRPGRQAVSQSLLVLHIKLRNTKTLVAQRKVKTTTKLPWDFIVSAAASLTFKAEVRLKYFFTR